MTLPGAEQLLFFPPIVDLVGITSCLRKELTFSLGQVDTVRVHVLLRRCSLFLHLVLRASYSAQDLVSAQEPLVIPDNIEV